MSARGLTPTAVCLPLATLCCLLPLHAQSPLQSASQPGQIEKIKLPDSWTRVTPYRESELAQQSIQDRDRGVVSRIDRAWSSGDPSSVVKLFRSPSRPAWFELKTRVRSSLMGGECQRTSRILSKEVASPYAALLLETRLRYPRPEGASPPEPVQIHELLILQEGADQIEPIYLIETSLGTLGHLGGHPARAKTPYSGLCISPGTSFACMACNYRLTLPTQGAWMIFARPSAESGLLESIELLSLESDIGLELSILPVRRTGLEAEQRSRRLLSCLEAGVRVLGSCSGKIDSETQVKRDDFFGLMGWTQLVLLRDKRMGTRFYQLHGMHGASLDYIVSLHGATDELRHKERIGALDRCFELLNPKRSNEEGFEILHRLHGGAGHFEGRRYIVKKLGLDITGPDQWNRFTQVDNAMFVGGFDCLRSGSVLYLCGIDRPGGHWDKKSTATWSVSWIERQKKIHRGLRNGRLTDVTISGAKGYEFDFDYLVNPSKTEARARGFLTMFPRGATLVVVMRVSHPVPAQKVILDTLRDSLGSLRFR